MAEDNLPVDPRHRLAQRYLQAARDDLAAKEAEKPKSQRKRPAQRDGQPSLVDLAPSIDSSTFVHGILLAIVLTIAALAAIWCYVVMDAAFVAGRIVAMPTGIVVFIAVSYASACFLGILESTAQGHTTLEHSLSGDWRDWFWTVPSTLGMLGIAAGLGFLLSRGAPQDTWTVIGVTILFVYPLVQLSCLETGSPAAPVSIPILWTLTTRPLIWLALYALSFGLALLVTALAKLTWRDPPYVTMLLMGPVSAAALIVYAWLLGQVARWLSIRGK
ncbi:MAG: hypothetical protein KDA57_12570 [Planctomycetales bacterium]|nr:hypothetical protein [Planctomycetales bacterium]